MPIVVSKTPLDGVLVLQPKVFGDDRGFFFESFNARDFGQAVGPAMAFVQDNHSRSARGVLRGLHYQWQHPQGKLVRVAAGSVFDVAVDLRSASPTFGRWFGIELSAANAMQLWVPPGFGHGFVVTSDSADLLYKTTDYWHPDDEYTLSWDDPEIGIVWPLDGAPRLSAKDANGLAFGEAPVFADKVSSR